MGCRASVEAALEEVPGVQAVQVNLTSQSATVVFDPAATSVDALRSAISEVGYLPQAETVVDGRTGGSHPTK